MTSRDLYQLEPVIDGVGAALAAISVGSTFSGVPIRVDTRAIDGALVPPMVLVVSSTGTSFWGPPMAGDQLVTTSVQIYAIGTNLAQAGALRDEAVWRLTGRATDGNFANDLTITNFLVVNREAHDFTPPEVIASVPQASVLVTLTLQRAS